MIKFDIFLIFSQYHTFTHDLPMQALSAPGAQDMSFLPEMFVWCVCPSD
jgi:hypothetical protein